MNELFNILTHVIYLFIHYCYFIMYFDLNCILYPRQVSVFGLFALGVWCFYFNKILYSASQKKRNREVSMFYHNLITTIINEWYIFGKLRVSSFMWCYSDNAYFTHEWLKAIWRKETKKTFGGRYLNFKKKFTFLESWVSALSYDTSIMKNERGMTKFCLFKVVLAFP